MVATTFAMAASSLFALTYGAPIARAPKASLVERATAVSYTVFGGDGSTASGWPSQSEWLSFDDLWNINVGTIGISCDQFSQRNNNDAETAAIKSAIQATATKASLPAEFILAIMMQESKGCVRVPTTNYGVRNPGLMQDHNGQATCNENGAQNPCPAATITQMIQEGAGIGTDFGLIQVVDQHSSSSGAKKYYQAARAYNSGSVASSGNLGAGFATHCYASDIANRLTGWNGENTKCLETSIGGLTSSTGNFGNGGNDDTVSPPPDTPAAPTKTSTPAKTPTPTPTPKPTPAPAQGNTNNGNTNSAVTTTPGGSGPAPGVNTTTCKGYYTIVNGDNCSNLKAKTGADFTKLRQLNTQIDANCSNLWLGYAYCVA